jgi:pimeloyl-CoA synthetase
MAKKKGAEPIPAIKVKGKKAEARPMMISTVEIAQFNNGEGHIRAILTPVGAKKQIIESNYEDLSKEDKKTFDDFIELIESL